MRSLTYLSFGAGVQSTALLVMSNLGLHGCPCAEVAIFADTQDEPAWVYENVERLRAWSNIPVETVSAGCISADTVDRHKGARTRSACVPAFTTGEDGRATPLRRQCTREYKIEPIQRRVREMLGFAKGEVVVGKAHAMALIGISLDECTRMSDSRERWIENVYPLVDARLRRSDCLHIITDAGLPEPRKSSCRFCPWHSDAYWSELERDYPEEWEKACQFDEAIRDMSKSGIRGQVFLHRSLRPLRAQAFSAQGRLFGDLEDEECTGGCFL